MNSLFSIFLIKCLSSLILVIVLKIIKLINPIYLFFSMQHNNNTTFLVLFVYIFPFKGTRQFFHFSVYGLKLKKWIFIKYFFYFLIMLSEILSFRIKLMQNELFYSVNCTLFILNKYLWFRPHWFKNASKKYYKIKTDWKLRCFP